LLKSCCSAQVHILCAEFARTNSWPWVYHMNCPLIASRPRPWKDGIECLRYTKTIACVLREQTERYDLSFRRLEGNFPFQSLSFRISVEITCIIISILKKHNLTQSKNSDRFAVLQTAAITGLKLNFTAGNSECSL
jgi:hypothetical protein